MVTINVTLLLEIATGIGIVGGACVWVKKLLEPFTQPLKDIEKKQKKQEKDIGDLEDRIETLEKELKEIQEATFLCLKTVDSLLEHALTGNHTDEMSEVKKEVKEYIFSK